MQCKTHKKPRKSEFQKLREKVGLGRREDAGKFFHVCEKTIKTWDAKGAPEMAMDLMRHHDRRDCGAHGLGWEGFRFSRGRLIHAREKLIFTPERLKLWKPILDRLDELEKKTETGRQCPVMMAVRRLAGRQRRQWRICGSWRAMRDEWSKHWPRWRAR